MSANKFVLKGPGVEVDYTIGGNPSFTALTYKAGATVKKFTPAAIETDDTGLGRMVSVPLIETIDVGGERFGFFLPVLNVPHGQTANFHTVGVYDTFSGPDSRPTQTQSWRCNALSGTAQTVIVPLAETAAE